MICLTQFKRNTIALLSLLGIVCAPTQAAPSNPSIGVQLWSVKDEIKLDFEATLSKLAKLGFQGVEFAGEFGNYSTNPLGLKAFMQKTGLQCAGAHAHFSDLNAANFEATTLFYQQLGCNKLIIAMDARGATREGSEQLAQELTALSVKLAAKGMKIGYHNHEQEMLGTPGQTNWDVVAQHTPHDVILEQDIGWTTFAGKDPIALVNTYSGRTLLTHFKAKFIKGTSGTPIIGQDKTNWAGLIQAVRSAGGTEWILIEQEEYPHAMGQLESVAASLQGLQAVLAKMPPVSDK